MITYDELQKLLKACRNTRDKAMISLLWDSGIRASELLQLRIRDFQLSKDRLYATLNIEKGSKNYRQRSVVLTGDSAVLVPAWVEDIKEKFDFNISNPLFFGIGKENLCESLNYGDRRAILQNVLARSKLEKKISPHLFRHSAATRLQWKCQLRCLPCRWAGHLIRWMTIIHIWTTGGKSLQY
jgi:integrase/recombinase XerD